VSVKVSVAVGVMLAVFVTVGEGPVAVGNGPISAFSVCAMAVLVLLAFLRRLFRSCESVELKKIEKKSIALTSTAHAMMICKKTRFSLTLKFTPHVLLKINFVPLCCKVGCQRNVALMSINDVMQRGRYGLSHTFSSIINND
jgi:hypothetical protein